ncbi:hypothetical protein NPS29_02100 [Pseudomonas putida]|uniref:hypothetical protein n=1 Tax=Pseudomonas putida TaxID=303 RepID=UPI0023632692|nr:hypothetical protein [Pseudomonas putida]MDD1964098.1 hypothetical protein [Pseudomonas putida]
MLRRYLMTIVMLFGIECLFVVDKLISARWPEQLEVVVGTFSVKSGGRDEYLSISNEQGTIVLSCSLGITGTTRCFSEEQLRALTGKRVTAHWYRQSVYGGIRNNKLVALDDGANVIRDPERTRSLDRSNIKSSAIVGGVIVGLMCLVWVVIVLRLKGRHDVANSGG